MRILLHKAVAIKATAWQLLILVTAILAAIPLLTVAFSFFLSPSENGQQLWQTSLPIYIRNSIILMLGSGFLSVLIGTMTAWLVSATDFPGRRLFSWLLVLPLAAPPYLIAYLYTDLLEPYGPVQTSLRSLISLEPESVWLPSILNLGGASFLLSLVLYPYIYLFARTAFSQHQLGQWHAARSLGQSPISAFFKIALPAARPAIFGGLALVMMETLSDFGVADYFAIPTFSTGIFRTWLIQGDKILAMKLATFMLFCVLMLVLLEAHTRRGNILKQDRNLMQAPPMRLSTSSAVAAIICCSLPILLGFIIPMLTLLMYHFQQSDTQPFGQFIRYAANSILIAAFVVMVTILIATLLAYAHRTSSSAISKFSIRIATLGYALPGALIAIGLLYPLSFLDKRLTGFLRDSFSWDGGLILSGTLIALTYALSIRFLTIAYNGLDAGLGQIPKNIDFASRSLGAKPGKLLRKIHFPLLTKSMLIASMLVFIDILRELPITLILRPFNFETLSTRIYWLASDEKLAQASTAALIIMLIGIFPALLLDRESKNRI